MKKLYYVLFGAGFLFFVILMALYFKIIKLSALLFILAIFAVSGVVIYFAFRTKSEILQPQQLNIHDVITRIHNLIDKEKRFIIPKIDLSDIDLVTFAPYVFVDDDTGQRLHAFVIIAPKAIDSKVKEYARWTYFVEWNSYRYDGNDEIVATALSIDPAIGIKPFVHTRPVSLSRHDKRAPTSWPYVFYPPPVYPPPLKVEEQKEQKVEEEKT
jgi:hypothetical protein